MNQGFNKLQLHFLGLNWPPEKGWCKKLVGTEITELDYERFVRAGEIGVRAMKEEIRQSMNGLRQRVEPLPVKIEREQIQTVWITFSDGQRACFSGRAVAFPGDTRTIRDISFTEPKPLPDGCKFDTI